jgi:hypothetical protein
VKDYPTYIGHFREQRAWYDLIVPQESLGFGCLGIPEFA